MALGLECEEKGFGELQDGRGSRSCSFLVRLGLRAIGGIFIDTTAGAAPTGPAVVFSLGLVLLI